MPLWYSIDGIPLIIIYGIHSLNIYTSNSEWNLPDNLSVRRCKHILKI